MLDSRKADPSFILQIRAAKALASSTGFIRLGGVARRPLTWKRRGRYFSIRLFRATRTFDLLEAYGITQPSTARRRLRA